MSIFQRLFLTRLTTGPLKEGRSAILLTKRRELSEDERARFARLISRNEHRTVQEVKVTWSDRMREEGKRETLLRQLTAEFGPLSSETIAKVKAVPSAAELDAYLERILAATTLEETGL